MSNREDELMDRILRETASSPVPGLSAAFDRRLAKAIRPRRPKSLGSSDRDSLYAWRSGSFDVGAAATSLHWVCCDALSGEFARYSLAFHPIPTRRISNTLIARLRR